MAGSQSDTPSQKKRQRTDSNGDQRIRSRYWFEDGSVVLQAEDTLFRVHQTILSSRSQIFKDTFAMPQDPSQENECIEGCPVVQLADTAEDVGNIISLLYDNDLSLKFRNKLSARVLGSMLRLGRKYLIDYLEDEAVERLHNDYPKTLDEWDTLVGRRQIENSGVQIKTTTEIISIAHEFGIFTIMPAAYAQYLDMSCLEGILGDTGIPNEARMHCILGNARIMAYVKDKTVDAICHPMAIPSKNCSSSRCQVNRTKIIKALPVWKTEELEGFGMFTHGDIEITEYLCPKCLHEVTIFTEKVRSDFWSSLPTFFGLAAWADLEDDP